MCSMSFPPPLYQRYIVVDYPNFILSSYMSTAIEFLIKASGYFVLMKICDPHVFVLIPLFCYVVLFIFFLFVIYSNSGLGDLL